MNTNNVWTIQKAKEELPPLKVRDGKNTCHAELRGRELPFPFVRWGDRLQYAAEVSWATVVHSQNTKTPVIV